jgi:hypothetical protein
VSVTFKEQTLTLGVNFELEIFYLLCEILQVNDDGSFSFFHKILRERLKYSIYCLNPSSVQEYERQKRTEYKERELQNGDIDYSNRRLALYMSSWLPALNVTHVPTMTNADPSTMDDEGSANRNSVSPDYIHDKYDIFNSEANLLHPHLQENAGLLPNVPRCPSPKAVYTSNGVMVSCILKFN